MGKRRMSRLARMQREKGTLKSPLSKLPGVTLSSWRDERLPEVLWAAILTVQMTREEYLQLFREIAEAARDLKNKDWMGLGHSRMANLSPDEFDVLFAPLIRRSEMKQLRALRIFQAIPDSDHWSRHLTDWKSPSSEDYDVIAAAVGKNSWHQSESATDIRWLRVLSLVTAGKMHFVQGTERQAEEILGYPKVGDLRAVRPSIRAAEQAFVSFDEMQAQNEDWVNSFWKKCKSETACLRGEPQRPGKADLEPLFRSSVDTYRKMEEHFHSQESYLAVDSRLDAAFGLSLYSLNLLLTMIAGNSSRRVEGRIILRCICEVYITFAYLLHVDAPKTWQQYRSYGQGQAKLAYLKSLDLTDLEKVKFVSEEDLENLANEDKWEEFLDIDLKSWSNLNLRDMSEKAGVKAIYDKYFGWPSGYVHGHWSSVRDTVFDLCLNPLHRLHRIPAIPRANMNDCAEDAAKLVNLTLALLNEAYPSFKPRIRS